MRQDRSDRSQPIASIKHMLTETWSDLEGKKVRLQSKHCWLQQHSCACRPSRRNYLALILQCTTCTILLPWNILQCSMTAAVTVNMDELHYFLAYLIRDGHQGVAGCALSVGRLFDFMKPSKNTSSTNRLPNNHHAYGPVAICGPLTAWVQLCSTSAMWTLGLNEEVLIWKCLKSVPFK